MEMLFVKTTEQNQKAAGKSVLKVINVVLVVLTQQSHDLITKQAQRESESEGYQSERSKS